jgi:hypothetical protein
MRDLAMEKPAGRTWAGSLLRPTRRRLILFAILAALWPVWLLYFAPEKRAVRQRLAEADDKSAAALEQRLKPVAQVFAKGRKGCKNFAEEALSWGGKWALAKGMLGIGGGDAHARYLSDVFARHIFSKDELRTAMQAAVNSYLIDLDGVESEMLVRLRADLENFDHSGQGRPSYLQSDEAFRQEYRRLADQVSRTLKLDAGVTLGREVGLLVAAEIASQVALQAARTAAAEMGVKAGVLGTGVASSAATLGVGMIIAVILDYVLDAIFKGAGYDPAAKIAGQVRESLDKMETALTGDSYFLFGGKKGALRQQMEKLHKARQQLRRETVAQFMKERNN